ncbi:hypothetical protein LPJ66_010196, partial [Kickxella alabastrina]
MVDAHSGWARGHTEILEQLGKDLLEACELWVDDRFGLGLEEFKENMSRLAELMAPRSESNVRANTSVNASASVNISASASANANASQQDRKGKGKE